MKKILASLAIGALLLLHQDWWNWTTAAPLAFGFLPVGLWYHALFTLAAALLMAGLVRWCWPVDLEQNE